MLEVRDISAFYGKHRALDGVSLDVGRSEIVVILGANGAGKTTLLKVIAGLVPAACGARITMNGRQLAGIAVHRIVEAGLRGEAVTRFGSRAISLDFAEPTPMP